MIKAKVTIAPSLPKVDTSANVVPAFQKAAGQRTVDSIKALIGTDQIYTLSDSYKKRKPALMQKRGSVAPPGKSPWAPLYLGGGLYGSIVELSAVGNTVTIGMAPGATLDKNGNDYGQMWQDKVDFLGKGLEAAEPEFGPMMDQVLKKELTW